MGQSEILSEHEGTIEFVRQKLTDITLKTLAVLLLPALIGSLWRVRTIGWMPIMYLHVFVYLVILTAAFFYRRLSISFKACLIAGTCYVLGVAGLVTFGLISNALLALIFFCFSSLVLMGRKTCLIAFTMTLVTLLVIGYLISNDLVLIQVDANTYGKRFSTWIFIALAFTPFVAFMLLCSNWLIEAVFKYAGKVKERSQALMKSNSDLQLEITKSNRMNEELIKYRTQLENLVQERTKELTHANELLKVEIIRREQKEKQIESLNDQLKQHLDQVEATNRELEAFSYTVSHDLRAPLRAINSFSQIILEKCAEKVAAEELGFMQRISESGNRMSLLIEGLLNLSLLCKSQVVRKEVDLSAVAKDISTILKLSQPDRKGEFIISDGLTALGDEKQLYQVIENLLGNAWKFTEKRANPIIEFGQKMELKEKVYFIKDNGAGFDMRFKDRLFSPFHRLHSESEFSGLGIGLATVQRIIHRHRGRIWAEAEVDRGATFYFTL